jgi:hypothetical protein
MTPEVVAEPAGSPLAGAAEAELVEADLEGLNLRGGRGRGAVGWKEGHLAGLAGAFVDDVEGALPGGALAVVEFAEVEDVVVRDLAVGVAAALDDRPVAVDFSVFAAFAAFEEHTRQLSASARSPVGGRSGLHALLKNRFL